MDVKALLAGAALSLAAAGSQALTLGDVLQGSGYDTNDAYYSMHDTGSSYVRLNDTDRKEDDAIAYLLFEFGGDAPTNKFGIFDTKGSDIFHLQLFAGSDNDKSDARVRFYDNQAWFGSESMWTDRTFGFYLEKEDGTRFYSDSSLNQGNYDYAAIFNTSGIDSGLRGADVIVAFEDVFGLGDRDFNDMVVGVSDVTPVPLPAGVLLLGAGVAGLGGLRRLASKSSAVA